MLKLSTNKKTQTLLLQDHQENTSKEPEDKAYVDHAAGFNDFVFDGDE